MKRTVGAVARLILALIVAAAGVVVAWMVARYLYSFLSSAPKEVSGALIGAFGVITGGTLVAIYQRRGAIEESLRKARTPVYERFMTFFMEKMFTQGSAGKTVSPEELQEFFMTFTKESVVLSSDRFVGEWSRYRRRLSQGVLQTEDMTAPNHVLVEFEKVLLEIRRDFGHRNRGLRVGDVLGMWVNDVPITDRRHSR